jgi:citrate synthase
MTVMETRVRGGLTSAWDANTAISTADPEINPEINPEIKSLTHGGYPVEELCRRNSFEEVAYLRWHGELPAHEQIFAQNRVERAHREATWHIAASIGGQPLTEHPLDTLRMAVRLLGAPDEKQHDRTPAAIRAAGLRLFAVLPSVIAADQRRRNGLDIIAPRDHLGYAANLLYMTFGKVPEPQIVAAFETSLILYSQHGVKSVGWAATRGSDLYSIIATAINALKDPGQATAAEAVMAMINEIAIPANAKPWLHEALTDGREIPGFGHDVRQDADSRVPAMRAALGMISALRGRGDLLEVSDALAAAVYDVKGLRPSLDYPAALASHLIGFDTPTFVPLFITACLPGWTAHIARAR